ncbi:MAG: hypothetical protein AAGK13_22450, partial [Pseudomonadota bacterium]
MALPESLDPQFFDTQTQSPHRDPRDVNLSNHSLPSWASFIKEIGVAFWVIQFLIKAGAIDEFYSCYRVFWPGLAEATSVRALRDVHHFTGRHSKVILGIKTHHLIGRFQNPTPFLMKL